MERSPHSAGVRARPAASLAHCHTLRSSVISLAIAIAIIVSPAVGFTIPRADNILDPVPDLETGESTQLEVRYDLRALNASKTADAGKGRGDTDPSVIAINDPKNVDKKIENNEKFSATWASANESAGIQSQITTKTKPELPSITTKVIPTEVTHLYTTSVINTSQTTTREPDKSQESSTKPTFQTSVATESQISTFKEHFNHTIDKVTEIKHEKNETIITELQNTSETKGTLANRNSKEFNNTEKHKTVNVTNNLNDSDVYKNDKLNSTSTPVGSNTERKNIARSAIETKSNIYNTTTNDTTVDRAGTEETNLVTRTDGPLEASTTVASEPETDATNVTFETPTTEWTTENINTETVTTDLNPPTAPSWKKYTTIDRKRTSTEDTTISAKDMARAETAQTRISLENVLNNTSIPSLEKLTNDLINSQEPTTKKVETSKAVENNVSSALNLQTSAQKIGAELKNETTKLEIVSKRAGYKDNRELTSLKPEEATTSVFPPKVSANDTEMFSSMYETEPSEIEVPDNKNLTVYESQSQLAEDAIKEELLREETLNDNEENAMRHHDEGSPSSKVKPLKPGKITDDAVITHEIVTEDMLSVKPITFDKKKNTILYSVSPNYKPLKKIEVRPPKPFVRDPDDNSWRNESISSLGIVFKPGNASKSFTQVLKNKTEIELGNMTDKDNKSDAPLDLKFRLERIAEVRKSKKKNKFGDNVYSDYEESGENAKDTTSPMSPPVESVLAYTPPPPPPSPSQSSTPEFDLTVNAISREKLDFFKNDGTTPLTTNKPKKVYNVAEYYDATDEYDADYVNNHKIELKKFTQPLKPKEIFATQPPELIHTKPMKEYQPERKATVQYFPPTQKVTQKVILNDYDTNFNRKVNLYSFKEPPKNVLPASFGTASPIKTEKYEQLNKVTVKPAFTPIYKTENWDKNLYLTNQPRASEPPSGFVVNDVNFNRASYVIKHYRDFINEAAKESDDDRSAEYPYTESPLRGVTISELAKMTTPRDNNQAEEEYDYDVKFRKDIISRFVDNFNQNSERFKVDFPILYNSSVVHRQAPDNGKVASSSAFLKRLYEVGNPRPSDFLTNRKPCDPHCDMTVELSPAYELHYYVPDQEEKEEIEPRPITLPNRYRL